MQMDGMRHGMAWKMRRSIYIHTYVPMMGSKWGDVHTYEFMSECKVVLCGSKNTHLATVE